MLRSKHSGWSWDGRRTPFMGGGGGGSPPSQTTQYTTNIPEYARPYVENMLGATQGQLFETQKIGATPDTQRQIGIDEEGKPIFQTIKGEEGRTEITGFKPYKPYSSSVEDYFAGFSPMQQQSFRGMAGMQPASQLGTATDIAGAAGLGSLGLGAQAAGAGARYAQMATDPYAVQSYMSPYMQNVVDYQKAAALRDYGMAMPKLQAQAVGQGAFGGNRLALQQAEAGRGLMSQLQGIQATGTQKAFEDAQRQQQFGAQLGLQGLQTGLQGYGQGIQGAQALGQLGQTQYGQQMGILEGLNKFGGQQQALEQQKINQAISDYATAQQYPMLQLGFMSNMLRGLPMQAQTTQMYQAQPSALQQGIGAVGALGSLYGAGAFGRKEGGIVGMRSGGKVPGYKYGALIPGPKLEGMANRLSIDQLEERLRDPALEPSERQILVEALEAKRNARMSGIAAAGGGLFEGQGMAGGGIIAFDNGGTAMLNPEFGGGEPPVDTRKKMTVEELFRDYPGLEGKVGIAQIDDYTSGRSAPPESAKAKPAAPVETAKPPAPKDTAKGATGEKGEAGARGEGTRPVVQTGPANVAEYLKEIKRLGPQGIYGESTEKYIDERLGLSKDRMNRAQNLAALQGFVEFGTKAAPGGIGQAALSGFGKYGEAYGKAFEAEDKIQAEAIKMRQENEAARRAEARGDVKLAAELDAKAKDRGLRIAEMENQLKVAGMQTNRPGEIERAFALFEKDPAKFREFIAARDTNRGNLATATKDILASMYPQYKLISMIPEEKRTKEQNEALKRMYKEATAEAERMLRKGTSTGTGGGGEVDTKNPLLGP